MKRKLVRGVGINDIKSPSKIIVGGKVKRCPFYQTWWLMLHRCYSEQSLEGHPTYRDKFVCEEWKKLSNFKVWMETQDWQGKQLDKDILLSGNSVYSPETCVFVSRDVNMFMIDREDINRALPQGVKLTQEGNYSAQVKWKGKSVHIGTYQTPQQAAKAYISRKRQLAIELANEQEDNRVKQAILDKFNGGGHWTEVVEEALNRDQ
jgi:hypothetical protein